MPSARLIPPAFVQHLPAAFAQNPLPVRFQTPGSGLSYVADIFLAAPGYPFASLPDLSLPAAPAPDRSVTIRLDDVAPLSPKLAAFLPGHDLKTPLLLMNNPPAIRAKVVLRGLDKTGKEVFFGEQTLPFILRGGLSLPDFTRIGNAFFTTYADTHQPFLTHQPREKPIAPHQPDGLLFLTNFEPPASMSFMKRVFTAATETTTEVIALTYLDAYDVYYFSTGMAALNIGPDVLRYEVYLVRPDGRRLSEVRTYFPDRRTRPDAPVLVFENGLGCYDSLYCAADAERPLRFEGNSARLATPDVPRTGERLGYDLFREATQSVTLRTGDYPPGWAGYFEQLLLSPDVRLLTRSGYQGLLHASTEATLSNDTEPVTDLTIQFTLDHATTHFSALR